MSPPPDLKSYASVVSATILPQKKPMLPNAKKSYAQVLSTCAAPSSFFQSAERPLTCLELISLFSTFSPHQKTPTHTICAATKQNVFVSIILDGEFKNTFCDAIRTWKGRFPLSLKQRQDFQSLWANLKTYSRQITQTLIDTPRIPRTEVPEDSVNMLRAHLQNFSP